MILFGRSWDSFERWILVDNHRNNSNQTEPFTRYHINPTPIIIQNKTNRIFIECLIRKYVDFVLSSHLQKQKEKGYCSGIGE